MASQDFDDIQSELKGLEVWAGLLVHALDNPNGEPTRETLSAAVSDLHSRIKALRAAFEQWEGR